MRVIGKDNEGHLIGVERGLVSTTFYKSRERVGLSGLDDLGFDWNAFSSVLNNNPILIGLGQKIAGQGGGAVPINPYQPVSASGPGFGGSINPMYLVLGGGALLLVLMMKR